MATEFWDYTGRHRQVSTATVISVLSAMGVPATTSEQVSESLRAAEEAPWRRVLPHSMVVRQGQDHEFAVHVPHGAKVKVHVTTEEGERVKLKQRDVWVDPREIDGVLTGRAIFGLPEDLPLGWHEIIAKVEGHVTARAVLAVTPVALPEPELRGGRGWGVMAQLYSVRSHTSWGVGDLADLGEIASVFGELGGDFVLVNPLHAAEPSGAMTPSPYLPTSRRFVNPIYIRPEDIRECAYLAGPDRAVVEWAAQEVHASVTDASTIDRDAAWRAKSQALDVIYAAERSPARQRSFERFRVEQGQGLEDFALWCAISERAGDGPWPTGLEDVAAARVRAAREELRDRIDYFCWLQWVADEQLGAAQAGARRWGMQLGIMHDLAVGVHPLSADVWAAPEVFARGISVGAPPDMYNQQGQDWSQPPWRPDVLAETGYAAWRDTVRTVLRHAGALRIDHIMGLFRLWWIPSGAGADEGTYVRYDHDAMVGVLLLEAHRSGAVVIGEDLGTVEPWVREHLDSRGVLGTSVLWFEKDDEGRPLPARDYRRRVLATVTTHDLPPTAGYLAEEHVDLRQRLGLLTDPEPVVRLAARQEREQMLALLIEEGLLAQEATERQIVEALHAYVVHSPAILVGVSLADAVGERRAQNQPGTEHEYPNWRVPLADGAEHVVLVEELASQARLRSLVDAVRNAFERADRGVS